MLYVVAAYGVINDNNKAQYTDGPKSMTIPNNIYIVFRQ